MSAILTTRICDKPEDWDALVWGHELGNVFCAWSWGEYKSRTGWTVQRVLVVDAADDILAIVQVQIKQIAFGRVFYLQGCPLLTAKGQSHAEIVIDTLRAFLDIRVSDLVMINFAHFECAFGIAALLSLQFQPVQSSKDYTLELDVRQDFDATLKRVDRGWRKSLNKAQRNAAISTRFLDDFNDRLAGFDRCWSMYGDLKRRKGFRSNVAGEHLRDLVARDPHFRILEIWEGDQCVLVRIAHVSGRRFTDFLVGSGDRARALGAAALSLWRFAEKAAEERRHILDLGGVDPGANQAVFQFKWGLSNRIVASGPRWVWNPSKILRNGAATYLSLA